MTTSGMTTSGAASDSRSMEHTSALAGGSVAVGASERTLQESLRRMIDSVRAETLFGPPVEREGVTVIPCVEVMMGFGMGGGSGSGTAAAPTAREDASAPAPNREPSGGGGIGGGGGAQGRPVAVVVISQQRVRVLPVFDATKLLIAGVTTAGVIAASLSQILARSRPPQPGRAALNGFSRAMRAARNRTL